LSLTNNHIDIWHTRYIFITDIRSFCSLCLFVCSFAYGCNKRDYYVCKVQISEPLLV